MAIELSMTSNSFMVMLGYSATPLQDRRRAAGIMRPKIATNRNSATHSVHYLAEVNCLRFAL
jgi:hypothetical protein